MENATKKAIEALAEKGKKADKADDALKFTQAALNLAHVEATYANIRNSK